MVAHKWLNDSNAVFHIMDSELASLKLHVSKLCSSVKQHVQFHS